MPYAVVDRAHALSLFFVEVRRGITAGYHAEHEKKAILRARGTLQQAAFIWDLDDACGGPCLPLLG